MNLYEATKVEVLDLANTNPNALVQALFDTYDLRPSQVGEGDTPDFDHGISLTEVDSEGGYEGGGSHVESVQALKVDGTVLLHFRITGFYESYNGTEWEDGFQIVYPRQVTVTQYFDKP